MVYIGYESGGNDLKATEDTVPLDLNFTYARVQKANARNIHCNAPE